MLTVFVIAPFVLAATGFMGTIDYAFYDRTDQTQTWSASVGPTSVAVTTQDGRSFIDEDGRQWSLRRGTLRERSRRVDNAVVKPTAQAQPDRVIAGRRARCAAWHPTTTPLFEGTSPETTVTRIEACVFEDARMVRFADIGGAGAEVDMAMAALGLWGIPASWAEVAKAGVQFSWRAVMVREGSPPPPKEVFLAVAPVERCEFQQSSGSSDLRALYLLQDVFRAEPCVLGPRPTLRRRLPTGSRLGTRRRKSSTRGGASP